MSLLANDVSLFVYLHVLYIFLISASQNNTSSSGTSANTGSGNGNNCPVFDTSCAADCAHIDTMGCLTCTCSGMKIKALSSK